MYAYLWLQIGSQSLRGILRGKGNPVEDMNAPDVKPFLQAALTTPEGEIVVDLEDPEVPVACITEGDHSQYKVLTCCWLPPSQHPCHFHLHDRG